MPQNYGALERVLRVGEGRRLKKLAEQAAYITSLEPDFEALSAEELAGKTVEFRQRLENGEDLDALVFEAYAAVREAARRSLRLRPFDVQLMGAIVLHEGDIAEMKTGEGKTLVATMPLYLNALEGGGVHLVTVSINSSPSVSAGSSPTSMATAPTAHMSPWRRTVSAR